MNPKHRKIVMDYLIISIGSILFAVGLVLFAEPFQIAPGGVSGIAIIINYLTDLPIGILIILLNIPLFAVGFWKLGFSFLFSSLYSMLLSSVAIDLLADVPTFVEEPLLAALYGGLVMGAGLGMVFMRGATTGGLDILARFLRMRFRNVKMGKLIFLTDLVVIAGAALVFGDLNRGLYAVITVYILGIVMDHFIYGLELSKVVYIMSEEYETITERLQVDLDRGVTLFAVEGGYKRMPTKSVMCAVKKQQIIQLYELVYEIDPEAFIIVTDAHEVLGFGFKKYDKESI